MSFTPTAGCRWHSVPAISIPDWFGYLARTEKMSAKQFKTRWVNFRSGLLGISETSSDMRDLLKHETQDVRAAEAVALFMLPGQEMDRRISRRRWVDWTRWCRWRHRKRTRPRFAPGFAMGWGFLEIGTRRKENAANEGVHFGGGQPGCGPRQFGPTKNS